MIRGNTPKCGDCKYYAELPDDKPRGNTTGWCQNDYQCKHGANGHRRLRPLPRVGVHRAWAACSQWISAETGEKRFEYLTGKKEKDDELD